MEQDRLIQGMAEGGDFRIIAAQTTRTVETARQLLDLAPVATDALGRALTGSLLLARLLDKNVKHQYVTLRLEGDGPLGVIIAEANVAGSARGYVANPVPLDASLEDLREKRSAVFIRLGEAYETLRSATSRKRYETAFPPRRAPRPEPPPAAAAPAKAAPRDPVLDEELAAIDFAKAQRLMGEEKYWDAIQILEGAIPKLEATASRRARRSCSTSFPANNRSWCRT